MMCPELIAETCDGVRIELAKIGGGTRGRAYAGDWQYRASEPAAYGHEGATREGRDLHTGTPKTHEQVAQILCEFLDYEWGQFRMVTGKYVVLCADGIGPGALGPEAPSLRNVVASLAGARIAFSQWLRRSGNDYVRAQGYDAPSALVYRLDAWDGISYGDYPVAMFVRGPRGGIVRESL